VVSKAYTLSYELIPAICTAIRGYRVNTVRIVLQ